MRDAFTADTAAGRPLAIFSDFDGTIAHPDTLNLLAESFAGVEFRRRIGRCIASGEVSLREGLARALPVGGENLSRWKYKPFVVR